MVFKFLFRYGGGFGGLCQSDRFGDFTYICNYKLININSGGAISRREENGRYVQDIKGCSGLYTNCKYFFDGYFVDR